MSEKVKLSASRVSTSLGCSYLYWLKYTMKIPDAPNTGSARGSCVHFLLEALVRKDRRGMVDKILAANDPWIIPSVKRLAKIYHKKQEILGEEDFEKIKNYVLKGLKEDFHDAGAEKVEIEHYFSIETDTYRTNGFLDKVAFYPDKIRIRDYKTSKKKFSAEKLAFNLQNFFYTFAIWKTFPGLPIEFEFLFLGEKRVIQKAPAISEDELRGFEIYLQHLSDYLTDFDYKKSLENPGKFHPENKWWICGKPQGSISKDGNPAWCCPYRYPTLFYELMEDGKALKSSRNKAELTKERKEGQEIIQREYGGCKFWEHEWLGTHNQ